VIRFPFYFIGVISISAAWGAFRGALTQKFTDRGRGLFGWARSFNPRWHVLRGASLAVIGTSVAVSWLRYGDKIPMVCDIRANYPLLGHVFVFSILAPCQYWVVPLILNLLLSRDTKLTEKRSTT